MIVENEEILCTQCGSEIDWWDADECDFQCCDSCGHIDWWKCGMCWGLGYGEESELECDWVNFGDEVIVCPRCEGKGWHK